MHLCSSSLAIHITHSMIHLILFGIIIVVFARRSSICIFGIHVLRCPLVEIIIIPPCACAVGNVLLLLSIDFLTVTPALTYVAVGHEIYTSICPLPLIHVGQLSVTGTSKGTWY